MRQLVAFHRVENVHCSRWPILSCSNTSLHHKAINVVKNLMASHDADPRYHDREVKARVAALYLPLIGIVMDILPQLYDPNVESRSRTVQRSKETEYQGIDQSIAMAIAGSTVYGLPAGARERRASSPDNSADGSRGVSEHFVHS